MKSYPQVQVQLYDISDDADRKSGEAYLKWIWSESPVFKKQHQELHIWSAGGDGTFKGVMDVCLRLGIDLTSPKLFFSVIPCQFLNGWTKESSSPVCFPFLYSRDRKRSVASRRLGSHDLSSRRWRSAPREAEQTRGGPSQWSCGEDRRLGDQN